MQSPFPSHTFPVSFFHDTVPLMQLGCRTFFVGRNLVSVLFVPTWGQGCGSHHSRKETFGLVRTVSPLFVVGPTEEGKICFQWFWNQIVNLPAWEDHKAIDTVPRTEPILCKYLHVDWNKTIKNKNWSLALPSRMPAHNIRAIWVGNREGSGTISFNSLNGFGCHYVPEVPDPVDTW